MFDECHNQTYDGKTNTSFMFTDFLKFYLISKRKSFLMLNMILVCDVSVTCRSMVDVHNHELFFAIYFISPISGSFICMAHIISQ